MIGACILSYFCLAQGSRNAAADVCFLEPNAHSNDVSYNRNWPSRLILAEIITGE